MNLSQLRSWARKYGDAGLILAVCYLGIWSLWTKRRTSLLATCILSLGLLLLLWPHTPRQSTVPSMRFVPVRPSITLPPVTSLPATSPVPGYEPHIPLLTHAQKIVDVSDRYRTHFWLSNSKLLLITSRKARHEKPLPDDEYDPDEAEKWHGYADLLNLHTGSSTRLVGLTRLLNIGATPGLFTASPDGQWLKWINYMTRDSWPNPVVARLDGTGFQDLGQDKFSYTYWLDSHRWVEQENRNGSGGAGSLMLIVHNVLTRRTQKFRLHSPQATRLMRQRYDADRSFFATDWDTDKYEAPSAGTTGHINEYTVGEYYASAKHDTADDDLLQPHEPPLRTFIVRLPKGTEVREALVTNEGKRVVYRLHCPGKKTGAENGYCDLWVSRTDGSHLHELGYVPDHEGDEGPFAWLSFQWLPDGRHLSFVYSNALYKIAVD